MTLQIGDKQFISDSEEICSLSDRAGDGIRMSQPMTLSKYRVIPWNPDSKHDRSSIYQMKAAYRENLIQHMQTLDPYVKTTLFPLTKIMYGAGPDVCSVEEIENLLDCKATTVLIPSLIFKQEEKIQAIKNIRKAIKNFYIKSGGLVYPLGIGLGLIGWQPYTGRLHVKPVSIQTGGTLRLTVNQAWKNSGTSTKVYIHFPYAELRNEISCGTIITIDAATIVLEVIDVLEEDIVCLVTSGGKLYNNRIVQLVEVPIMSRNLTEQDLMDIELAINMELDFLLIPCVESEYILKEIKTIISEREHSPLLVAKIQSKEASKNTKHIVNEADVILIARNYLGQEVDDARIFSIQDKFLATCKLQGKPLFIEGKILKSVRIEGIDCYQGEINSQEVVASCQKGIDGILMRDTLTYGLDVTQTFRRLLQICSIAEPSHWHSHFFNRMSGSITPPMLPIHALGIAVCRTAMKAGVVAILVCTATGEAAKIICRYMPKVPVIAISRHSKVARQLTIYKAAIPCIYTDPPVLDFYHEIDLRILAGISLGRKLNVIKPGDCVILVNGSRPGPGSTNCMRVVYVSSIDTVTCKKFPKDKVRESPVSIFDEYTELNPDQEKAIFHCPDVLENMVH